MCRYVAASTKRNVQKWHGQPDRIAESFVALVDHMLGTKHHALHCAYHGAMNDQGVWVDIDGYAPRFQLQKVNKTFISFHLSCPRPCPIRPANPRPISLYSADPNLS